MNAASVCPVWLIVLAGCVAVTPPAPAASADQPALLVAGDAACLSAIAGAAHRLSGHPVTLAADAFLLNDSVVLTSAGQMVDGRARKPLQVLQLRLVPQICEMRLEGQESAIALKECRCRPATSR